MIGLNSFFISCLIVQCLMLYYCYLTVRDVQGPAMKMEELIFEGTTSSSFIYPEERERFDWGALMEPCKSDMQWRVRNYGENGAENQTSAKDCVIIRYQINPPGYYSMFVLQTRTRRGIDKAIGGDYWRAYLTGSASLTGHAIDLKNGRYEIWFLILEPGDYELNLVLEYSLCHGLRDPPLGWFERGNVHGRFQEEGILGYINDFLMERVSPIPFTVESTGDPFKNVSATRTSIFEGKELEKYCKSNSKYCFTSEKFKRNCNFVWDGYGRWEKHDTFKWTSNFPVSQPADYSKKAKLETLWFLGDSLSYRLWDSSYTRVLCRQAFKNCKKTYTWVYELKNNEEKKGPVNVGDKFNKTRFFEPLHSLLDKADMKSNRSVVVINFGLHLVMTLNFSEYRDLLETFATIIDQYRGKEDKSSVPQFIWKTTSLSHKENTARWNVTQARFLTNQRITLFNAYANARLCTAGVPILDIFPISASFENGTLDHVHYHNSVFQPVEDALADYVWKHYNM